MIVPTFDQINQLYLNKKITLTFKQILEKNFLYSTYGNVTHVFNWLLADKDKRLDDKDILWATHYLDSLYSALPPFDESILKYVFSYKYLKGYYKRIYKGLNQDERDNLLGKYSSDTFGPYKHYLLCPESFLSSLFGDAIIAELTLGIDFFFEKTDKDKFVGYFEENYPKSQFLPAIKKKMQEMKKAEMVTTDGTDSIIILENRISSLKDLPSIKNLKGKYLFVDLWATWCIPCKQEFQHKQDLDKVLVQYQNIVPLYISIDKDALDESWRKNINQYALTGYHIRASEALQNDILQQVNNSSKSLAIPRYMLLDDSGNIVNDNMPRPSAIDILKKELDKLM